MCVCVIETQTDSVVQLIEMSQYSQSWYSLPEPFSKWPLNIFRVCDKALLALFVEVSMIFDVEYLNISKIWPDNPDKPCRKLFCVAVCTSAGQCEVPRSLIGSREGS